MKVITLWEPFATLIACAAKPTETRSWPTSYRGPLLIHAALRRDEEVVADCRRCGRLLRDALASGCWRFPSPAHEAAADRPFGDAIGRVLAVASLVDCKPTPSGGTPADRPYATRPVHRLDYEFGDWSPGRFGWRLADVRPLPVPVPWRGQRGLRDAPPGLAELVESQLGVIV